MRKRFGAAILISSCLLSGQSAFAQDSKLIAEAAQNGSATAVTLRSTTRRLILTGENCSSTISWMTKA